MAIRKIIAVCALGAGILVSGCNTVAGLGRDVESVGDKVTDCAEDRCRD